MENTKETTEHIINVAQEDFNQKIIEESETRLVLIDFWAPWCGPCKQLTPVLERIASEANGLFLLAKVNVDENKELAGQLNIKSMPTVYAFKNKKILDTFQGVIPEKQIIEFIEKNLGKKIKKDLGEFYLNIENLFIKKDYISAKEIIETELAESSSDVKVISLYIECLGGLNLIEESQAFVDSLDKDILKNSDIQSSIHKISIKNKNKDGPPINELKKIYDKNPNNIESILKLSEKYFAENKLDECFELLFKNFQKKREVKKEKILYFFNALGLKHEKTILYRKKLSSIIFS